jgi:hypothetical protein
MIPETDILEFAKKLAEGARAKAMQDELRYQAIKRAEAERQPVKTAK